VKLTNPQAALLAELYEHPRHLPLIHICRFRRNPTSHPTVQP